MTEIEIYGTGKTVSIPSSWDEMSPEQVQSVFRTYDSCLRRGGSPLEFNIRVLFHLLGAKFSRTALLLERLSGAELTALDENVTMLCDRCLGFLLEVDGETRQCRLTFDSVANPLPTVRSGRFRLIGPSDLLQNLTFGEFRHAGVAMQSFFRTGKMSDLDECLVFLYRRRCSRANRAGRRVVPVGPGNIERETKLVSALAPWQKNLILLWFAACLKFLQTADVAIDGERVELGRLFGDSGNERSAYSFGWNDLAVQIAKDRTVGNIERVDEEPLFSILGIMWHNFKEQKRYEEISKAH